MAEVRTAERLPSPSSCPMMCGAYRRSFFAFFCIRRGFIQRSIVNHMVFSREASEIAARISASRYGFSSGGRSWRPPHSPICWANLASCNRPPPHISCKVPAKPLARSASTNWMTSD